VAYHLPFCKGWAFLSDSRDLDGPHLSSERGTLYEFSRGYLLDSWMRLTPNQSAGAARVLAHSRIDSTSSARVTLSGCVERVSASSTSVVSCCFCANAV